MPKDFVEHVVVDHDGGQNRCCQRQRVQTDAEAIGTELALTLSLRQRPKERPAIVVDRLPAAPVVLRVAQKLFGEFPDDVAPEVEVVCLVPGRQAAWLELAGGYDVEQPPCGRYLVRLSPVQQERGRAPGRVASQG